MSRNFLRRMSDGNPQAYAITGGSAQFTGGNRLDAADSALQWDGHSAFSLALWWYSGTLPPSGQCAWIVSQTADPHCTSGFGLKVNGTTGFLNWMVADNPSGGTGSKAQAVPNLAISANTWYLILVFSDNSTAKIYVQLLTTNGTEIDTQVTWVTPGAVSPALLTLGSGPSGTDTEGNTMIDTAGRIDNLGFWARLLTAPEYTAMKNIVAGQTLGVDWSQIAATSLSDAKAFYNLDAIAGKLVDVRDNTGNGRNLINHPDGNGVIVAVGPERRN